MLGILTSGQNILREDLLKTLRNTFVLTDSHMRLIKNKAQKRGVLIGSSCSGEKTGYYLIRNSDDLKATKDHLLSKAYDILETCNILTKS